MVQSLCRLTKQKPRGSSQPEARPRRAANAKVDTFVEVKGILPQQEVVVVGVEVRLV
jgi:hypothetical protein